MGIKFLCPNGHKLHVKSFLASQRGVCPHCGQKFIVPAHSIPEIRVESIGVRRGNRRAQAGFDAGAAGANHPDEALAVAIEMEESEAAAANEVIAPVGVSRPNDPIAEAPTAVWYVRIADGSQFGPAPGDMMRRWLDEGRVATDSLVWREGWGEWRVAGGLFPQLAKMVEPPDIGPGAFAAFEQKLAEQVETLVIPSAAAPGTGNAGSLDVEPKSIRTSNVHERLGARRRRKMALIALVVAIACLLPVFVYVLFNQ